MRKRTALLLVQCCASRILLFILLSFMSCSHPTDRWNVIVLLVDTLRADHLGCYGYPRDTSPNLDRLSKSSLLFTNVTSQAPWTNPSVATLFTSLYPSTHHLVTLKSGKTLRSLDERIVTLTELLKRQGYDTAAFTANPWLSPGMGVDRGFDVYKNLPFKTRANILNEIALEWVRARDGTPFFLYVHYMDVHGPYLPPSPYDTFFAPPTSPPRPLSDEELARMPGYLRIEGLKTLGDYVARYDGGIRFWDECLGRFLSEISQEGELAHTVLLITADHGEEFLEHGGFNHGSTLYEEQLRVPLVMRFPDPVRNAGGDRFIGTVEEPVELVDVMPTLLSLLGIRPPEALQGDDLRPLIEGGRWESKPAFSEAPVAFGGLPLPGGTMKSVKTGNFKLILNIDTGNASLYDLSTDPGELVDRSQSALMERTQALSHLTDWSEACSLAGKEYQVGERPAGEDLLKNLRALGYLENE